MKGRKIAAWVLITLVAAGFCMAALGKFSGAQAEMFAQWGYPAWFALFIGSLEGLGAIGLLVPKTTRWAVYGLTLIMLGAAITHIVHNEGWNIMRPVIFTSLMWGALYLRNDISLISYRKTP